MEQRTNCPSCHAPVQPGQAFCPACGHRLQPAGKKSRSWLFLAGGLVAGLAVCLCVVVGGLVLFGPRIGGALDEIARQGGSTTPTPFAPVRKTPSAVVQPKWAVARAERQGKVQVTLQDGRNTFPLQTDAPAEETRFERWEVAYTLDLDGNGSEDAVVHHFTGGAHCCSEWLFFGSEPGAIRLYDAFGLGNGGLTAVEDLDGDGIPELIAGDDRFSYFADLSYAETPFLQMVICQSKAGTYADCSRRFPQYLQESADYFEDRLKNPEKWYAQKNPQKADALGFLAAYMRLGKTDEGWQKVKALNPGAEPWLRQHSTEIQKAVASEHLARTPGGR